MLALQRSAGNAAVSALLARDIRRPHQHDEEVLEQAHREADDGRKAQRDVDEFYHRVEFGILAHFHSKALAVQTFMDIVRLKDPPDVAAETFKAIAGAVFGLVPGWAAVQKGLTVGVFAVNLLSMEKALGEKIGTEGMEKIRAAGPTEREVQAQHGVRHRLTTAVGQRELPSEGGARPGRLAAPDQPLRRHHLRGVADRDGIVRDGAGALTQLIDRSTAECSRPAERNERHPLSPRPGESRLRQHGG